MAGKLHVFESVCSHSFFLIPGQKPEGSEEGGSWLRVMMLLSRDRQTASEKGMESCYNSRSLKPCMELDGGG